MKLTNIIICIFLLSSSLSAQDRTVMNRHKFDTERPDNIKHRDLTFDVDSSGFSMFAFGDAYMKLFLSEKLKQSTVSYETGDRNGYPYMRYGNQNFRFQMYINKGGSFEFDAEIRRLSPTGKYRIAFYMETEGLDFFYQDALTDIERGPPYETIRPDSVVGSYAVYHSTKRNDRIYNDGREERFGTGKVTHIYPSWAWNNTGDTVKAIIEIKPDSFIVSVSDEWGASQTLQDLPITIDPTFGYTTDGASTRNQPSIGTTEATKVDTYVASTGDIVTEYHMWSFNFGLTTSIDVGLYTFVNDTPLTLVTASRNTLSTANTSPAIDNSVTGLSISLTNGVEYCIGYAQNAGTVRMKHDSVLDGIALHTTGVFPTTFVEAVDSNVRMSIWAVFTESGGAVTPTRRRRLGEYSEKATFYSNVPVLRN